ncbi:MAG: cytoplasmic protein [Pseudomonadota bacterium]
MSKHSHQFVEQYNGLVGFGLDREADGYTLTYYLQKFSDDQLMGFMRDRLSESDMEELFNLLGRLLKTYLTEEEYHKYFLKDEMVTSTSS